MAVYRSWQEYSNSHKGGTYDSWGKDPGMEVNKDSDMRNFIASQMQYLSDNNIDLGESMEFFNAVSGLGEGNMTFKNTSAKAMGGEELRTMCMAMAQLYELQTSGMITTDEYADYMKRMTSPDMVKAFAESENDKDMLKLFNDIDNSASALERGAITQEQVDANKAANAEEMKMPPRDVINDAGDYVRNAQDRGRSNEKKTYSHMQEHYADGTGIPYYTPEDIYDARDDMDRIDERLLTMKEAGLIDDKMYDALRDANMDFTSHHSYEQNTAFIYAMGDMMALHEAGKLDQDTVNRIMSADFMKDPSSKDSLQALSDLDYDVRANDIGIEVDNDRAKNDSEKSDAAETKDNSGRSDESVNDKSSGESKHSDGRHEVSFSDDELATLREGMYNSYFDSLEMDDDQINDFLDTLEEYRAKKGDMAVTDEQKEMIDKIDRIDMLVKGIDMGHLGVSCSDEPDPETGKYSYMFTDDHGVDGMPRNYDSSYLDMLNDSMHMADGTYDPDEKNRENEGMDDGEENENEGAENNGTVVSSGTAEQDYDADFTLEDVEILGQKSPSELADEKLALAQRMWRGDFGNGTETRIAAFEEMGLSEADYREIQDITNMGYEWVMNATPEDYNNAFNPGSPSLEEQDAAFRQAQAEAAARIMTYEGAEDLSDNYQALVDAYNAQHEGNEIEAGDAAEIYDNAYATYGDLSDEEKAGISEEITVEADANLNLEGMIAGGDFEDEQTTVNSDRAGEKQDTNETTYYDSGSTGGQRFERCLGE